MPLKVDWLKNDHELGEKVYIFFHFRQVGFGGLIEEGEIVIYGTPVCMLKKCMSPSKNVTFIWQQGN